MKTLKLITTIALAGAMTLMTTSVIAKERTKGRGAEGSVVIYVTSQDMFTTLSCLETCRTTERQIFRNWSPVLDPTVQLHRLSLALEIPSIWWSLVGRCEYGRYMDETDVYFLCPLLGPGRDEP